MKIYQLEKWYFDLLTSDHDFFFFYYARIRFGMYQNEQINWTFKSGTAQNAFSRSLLIHSSLSESGPGQKVIRFKQGRLELKKEECSILLNSEDTALDLNFIFSPGPPTGDALVIRQKLNNKITWIPLAIRTAVAGKIQIPPSQLSMNACCGYVDYMNSTIFPRYVPVRQLFWGRFHFAGGEIAFTCALGPQPEQKWSKIFSKTPEGYSEFSEVDVNINSRSYSEYLKLDYPSAYTMTGRSSGLVVEIQIDTIQSLVESYFIDRRFTAPVFLYHLYRYVSLNPRGIKFLSTCRINLKKSEEKLEINNTHGVTEYVVFK
jgi:hypothetical protein